MSVQSYFGQNNPKFCAALLSVHQNLTCGLIASIHICQSLLKVIHASYKLLVPQILKLQAPIPRIKMTWGGGCPNEGFEFPAPSCSWCSEMTMVHHMQRQYLWCKTVQTWHNILGFGLYSFCMVLYCYCAWGQGMLGDLTATGSSKFCRCVTKGFYILISVVALHLLFCHLHCNCFSW